jgi:hypothetical protein
MTIEVNKLKPEEKEKYDEGWNKYAFNNYASTLIPYNRSIPDIRLPGYNFFFYYNFFEFYFNIFIYLKLKFIIFLF